MKNVTGQPDTKLPRPPRKSKESDLRRIVSKTFEALLPVVVTAAMILWLFHKVKVSTIMEIIRNGCDYYWLVVMCVVLVASRSIRGIRWGIQLRAAGIRRMPAMAEMVSIYGAYAINLIVTWLGEAWRCIYVARRQKAPLTTVVGTDIGDRLSDFIVISSLIVVCFFVAHPTIEHFMDEYSFSRQISDFFSSPWLIVVLVGLIAATVLLLRSKSKNTFVVKFQTGFKNLWEGFKVLFTLKQQGLYWTFTVMIWVCYFLMTYLSLFAFPFTRQLITPQLAWGLLPGLVVFVFGAISIAVPATGGLGPWNIAVIFALSLYGVDRADATAWSMVVWAFQSLAQALLGIVAAAYVSYDRHHRACQTATSPAEPSTPTSTPK